MDGSKICGEWANDQLKPKLVVPQYKTAPPEKEQPGVAVQHDLADPVAKEYSNQKTFQKAPDLLNDLKPETRAVEPVYDQKTKELTKQIAELQEKLARNEQEREKIPNNILWIWNIALSVLLLLALLTIWLFFLR